VTPTTGAAVSDRPPPVFLITTFLTEEEHQMKFRTGLISGVRRGTGCGTGLGAVQPTNPWNSSCTPGPAAVRRAGPLHRADHREGELAPVRFQVNNKSAVAV